MRVDLKKKNPALVSICEDPSQVITLDANFLIPPDRKEAGREISFSLFHQAWLKPIFETFPNVAIHEAVYDELVSQQIRTFIDEKIQKSPPEITIYRDSQLTHSEQVLRNTFEAKISRFTKYDPQLNNKADRGEVKTLAFVAVKGLLYFATHDHNTIQLIEKAESWGTGLDTIQAIKMYELICVLCEKYPSLKKGLKALYKYQYYLTRTEQSINPEWGVFNDTMRSMYTFTF